MPLVATTAPNPVPQYWTVFGHSYYQIALGTRTQQGRADAYVSRLLYTQPGLNGQNHCAPGIRLSIQGDWGFGRVLQVVRGWTGGAGNLGNTAPYVVGGYGGSGGAYLLGWGINDLGYNGNTTQMNTAYQMALRTVISRCRMSTIGSTNNLNYPGGTGTFAVSGFASTAVNGYSTADTLQFASTTTSSITITLPADYAGETVAILFMCSPGGTGNTLTFTGTAGVTGTISTSGVMPSATLNNGPYIRRITNLTSAAASHTIIITITTLDTNWVFFDSWWLEADNPPPVIVANTARLCSSPSGYAGYAMTLTASGLSGTAVTSTPSTITVTSTLGVASAGTVTMPSAGGTVTITYTGSTATTMTGCTASGGSGNYSSNTMTSPGPTDADVVTFNTYLTSLLPEFDAMVQVADIDTALNKSAAWFSFDGLHPNELGASRIAQAVYNAVQRLVPTSPAGQAANLNPPGPVLTPVSIPSMSGNIATSDTYGGPNGTAYTPVIGDMWALPIFVSSGVTQWTNWVMEMVTASVAPTVFMAVYDDRQMAGYPQWMTFQPANVTALSLLAAPGVFTSTNTSSSNGYLKQSIDPGLYWLVVKWVTTGTCTIRTCKGPSKYVPNLTAAGAGGTTPCGWKLTGQGTTAMTGRFPSGAALSDNVPMIGVKVV